MNSNVAHASAKRPSKASTKKPSGKIAAAQKPNASPLSPTAKGGFFSAADAHEYGGACLKEARTNLDRMAALVLIDEDDLDRTAYRDLASGLATNLCGAVDSLDALANIAADKEGTSSLTDSGERPAIVPPAVASASSPLEKRYGDRVREQIAWVMLAQKRRAEGGDERACDLEIVGALEQLASLSIELDEQANDDANRYRTASARPALASLDREHEARYTRLREVPEPAMDLEFRKQVDRAIEEIEGLAEGFQEGLDRALGAHIYLAGSCAGDCSGHYVGDPKELHERFNEGIAHAVAHMKCVANYLNPLRTGNDTACDLDAAAEE